jgi:hypothetical protein
MYDDERKSALMEILQQMNAMIDKGYGESAEKVEEEMPEMAENLEGDMEDNMEDVEEESMSPYKDEFKELLSGRKLPKKEGVAMVFAQNKGQKPGKKRRV